MISRELVLGVSAAVAILATTSQFGHAMAITDVELGEAVIGGAPVSPLQLANGNAVSGGDPAAPLPAPVDPASVILPGFLVSFPLGGAVEFTEAAGSPVAGYYTSNFSLAQSSGPFGERRFFSVDENTQIGFLAEPSYSIGASGETSDFSVSLFKLEGPSNALTLANGEGEVLMDVTQVTLETTTPVSSLVPGANFVSPDLVFGTAVIDPGSYFFDILASTDAENAGYKFEIQYQSLGLQEVPLPAGVWLFLSGLAGLICVGRFRR